MKFKLIPIIALSSLFIISCEKSDAEKLKEEIAEKNAEVAALQAEIEAKKLALADLDTSAVHYPKVMTIPVQNAAFEHFFSVQGEVKSDKNVIINAEIPGTVDKIYVKEGQFVSKGQMLMKINSSSIDAQINELKEALNLADFVYEKQKKLHDQGIGSDLELKQAENNKIGLEKKLNTLRTQVGKTIISAPFAGYVDQIIPNEGEMTNGQMGLIRLINIDQVKVVAAISESHLKSVKKGKLCSIEFPVLDLKMDSIPITRASKFINPNNRTFEIEVNLNNKAQALLPNLLAKVHVRDFALDSAISVPQSAVMQDNMGNNYVYIVNAESKIEKRSVMTGLSQHEQQVILDGIAIGEALVVKGQRGVKDGQIVEIKTTN